jgi:hypothetical protein
MVDTTVPAINSMKPMSLPRIYGTMAVLYLRNFWVLIGIVAIIAIPQGIATLALGQTLGAWNIFGQSTRASSCRGQAPPACLFNPRFG